MDGDTPGTKQDRINLDFDELAGNFSSASVSSNRKMNETVGGMNSPSAGGSTGGSAGGGLAHAAASQGGDLRDDLVGGAIAFRAARGGDRKSTRLNSSHTDISRMPSSA